MTAVAELLPVEVTDQLSQAVRAHYGSVAVAEVLGLPGQAALARSDLTGVERLTRGGSQTETLIRLFLLGLPVPQAAAAAALKPLTVQSACAAGLLAQAGQADQQVWAALDLRPYSEAGGPDWWLLSDLSSDTRGGPLGAEHVLGLGSAASTLAQATVRDRVDRALDVATGCGVQALHLSRHCATVTCTDLSERALAFAATTARLNDQRWGLRAGSLLEPVAGESFELIVCNPPFIVGPGFRPGAGGYRYRDSGLAGDSVCARLVGELPARLTVDGTAQLLANWIIGQDQPWPDRVAGWLPELGCDAWIWQREVADPGEYVAMWLRDGGEQPGTDSWRVRYDRWLDWFVEHRVVGIGMGLISIRRTGAAGPSVRCEDVRQAYQQPAGTAIGEWFDRRAWLRSADLPQARLRPAADLVLESRSLISGAAGWQPMLSTLRQSHGMRWELEVDEVVAALVAASSQRLPLAVLLELVAASVDAPVDAVSDALLSVVRDLVERGFLLPEGSG